MATFTGGAKLTAALGQIVKQAEKAKSVSIGWKPDATYSDGTSVALVAALNEFGTGKAPPRPYFRDMIQKKSPEWPKLLEISLLSSGFDTDKALGSIGAHILADLQESISNFSSPPLNPVTIMLRGMRNDARYAGKSFGELIKEAIARVTAGKTNYGASTKPLVDLGIMLQEAVFMVNK